MYPEPILQGNNTTLKVSNIFVYTHYTCEGTSPWCPYMPDTEPTKGEKMKLLYHKVVSLSRAALCDTHAPLVDKRWSGGLINL